ncbi:hypothetical protein [Cyclobacterium marinum]|uniref:hypothetical protein n=1 Tax=Cyclobacterium marinum TaxID=104 RepID=UPI0011EF1C6A|nr:hypothetical protein [Cyclobacterium marinum]MBI0399333.1 hypothetical protein [Cyclobacterium marinum]
MKNFALKTFKFLLFAGLFYLVTLILWGELVPQLLKPNLNYKIGANGHLYSRVSEIKNFKDVDILFLGSSHTYRGFDPRIFSEYGYKSFNLGSSAQSHIQTKVLFDRYFETLNPKVVIYEVYPATFHFDGVESSLDLISNDKNDFYSLEMVLKINNIKTYNTFFYCVIRDFLGLNESFTESPYKGNNKYISGGYVENKMDYFKPYPLEEKEVTIKDSQFEPFVEIVEELKQRNIELVLVYAPIPRVNYDSYTNTTYFDSLMSTYSTYYNFNEIVTLEDSVHFIDSHHLNQNGVEEFNKKLIEILEKDNAL